MKSHFLRYFISLPLPGPMIMRFLLLTFLLLFSPALFAAGRLDTLPLSQIDIPIQISLRPMFRMAEQSVDTVFTSPGYPNGWVLADCATRYKYRFRRSPLRLSASGTTLQLGFTGFYQITGSTRACVGGTVLSPWTPECTCGFEEGERRVNIGFSSSFNLRPDYLLQTRIVRSEPQAVDKCSVCFWGQDITQVVMDGLKSELDLSKKDMERQFGNVNLRPYVQQAWKALSSVYAIPNVGYFSLKPQSLRMQNINARNDLLNISIGVSATPLISFEPPAAEAPALPNLSNAATPGGFNIHLEAALRYDSLSHVMNGYLAGKRFNISEGLIKNHVVVDRAEVSGDSLGHLLINVDFSGSYRGRVQFTGKPYYDAETRTVEVREMDYSLQTRSLLLNTAKWLFNRKIVNELKKYARFDLSAYYDTASKTLHSWLNKEWTPGVSGSGSVKNLRLTEVEARPEHLVIRSLCAGNLSIRITEIDLRF